MLLDKNKSYNDNNSKYHVNSIKKSLQSQRKRRTKWLMIFLLKL
ncbi:MAG: hypothetical protein K5829_06350 [Treponema sp.]|nr:hypothetical protein [Treponema sp.]